MRKIKNWRVLDTKVVVDERWYKLRKDKVELPDGKVLNDYFVSIRPDIVVILAVSQRDTVPLVRQYKHGAGEVTLELPAGTFTTEAPIDAARRELKEETGWDAEKYTCVGVFFDDASKNSNRVHCVVAENARRVSKQELDVTEGSSGVELINVSLKELPRLLATGEIKAQSSVASAYLALAWLKEMR